MSCSPPSSNPPPTTISPHHENRRHAWFHAAAPVTRSPSGPGEASGGMRQARMPPCWNPPRRLSEADQRAASVRVAPDAIARLCHHHRAPD